MASNGKCEWCGAPAIGRFCTEECRTANDEYRNEMLELTDIAEQRLHEND